MEKQSYSYTQELPKQLSGLNEADHFRLLVKSIENYAIFMLDRQGIVVSWNEGAKQIKGYDAEEIIGQHFSRFYTEGDKQKGKPTVALQTAVSQRHFEEEAWRVRRDGSCFWANITLTALYNDFSELIGFAKVTRDISERRQLEIKLQQQTADLEQRVAERASELFQATERLGKEIGDREQVEAAEREQRALAEALRDTTSALNSTLDLDEVLNRILINVDRVVAHDGATIMLVESGVARVVRFRSKLQHEASEAILARRFMVADTPVLQQMAESKRPLTIPSIKHYPSWIPLPNANGVGSYMGAPIQRQDQIIGFLNLNSNISGFFSRHQSERLGAFADQAAIAIYNAQHYAQAQELAVLKERERLARELHDAVSQTLWSTTLIADVLPSLWEQDVNQGREHLRDLRQLVHGALAEMRTLLFHLRPASLTEVEIEALLEQLVTAVSNRTGITPLLSIKGSCQLPANVQVVFYRITQEALNNITRHALATQVTVQLQCHANKTQLVIKDNGCGFDPAHIPPGHMGVSIMHERATTIGATLEVKSRLGKGTQVQVTYPGL